MSRRSSPHANDSARRSTRSNTANNTNPPNEIADEVTRQLNTALPNQLTQLVLALGGNRTNQREGLAPEIKAHVTSSKPTSIQSAVSMANRLTTDGIKDGIIKKKENAGNKKRSNDQNRNQERDDRNKRQRTRRNFALTAQEQGQGQRVFMALDCLIFLKTPSDGVTMKSRVPGIILVRGTVLEIGRGLQANGVHEVSKRSLMAVEVYISFDGFWFL
ncbi:hypothetical protein Tco_1431195 [Tanacetum coccineum]